jgi:hypothetical protein
MAAASAAVSPCVSPPAAPSGAATAAAGPVTLAQSSDQQTPQEMAGEPTGGASAAAAAVTPPVLRQPMRLLDGNSHKSFFKRLLPWPEGDLIAVAKRTKVNNKVGKPPVNNGMSMATLAARVPWAGDFGNIAEMTTEGARKVCSAL